MLDIVKVEMPKKKIYKIKRNGKVYVYYTLRAYRNEKGNPTSDSIIIGKEDTKSGMLIPNDTFFDIFECDIKIDIKVKGEKKHD